MLKILALVDGCGVPHALHIRVGEVGETVAKYVKKLSARQIAMGTRGLGPLTGMLLGSVTTKVVQAVDIPIVLVK
jgi:nucleotide-binding universal stress UspA family protein